MQRSRYSSCCLINFKGINKFYWIQVLSKRKIKHEGKKKTQTKVIYEVYDFQ